LTHIYAKNDFYVFVLSDLDLQSSDVKCAPLLLLSSAMFPPNQTFLRLSYCEKIGGTERTERERDRRGASAAPMGGRIKTYKIAIITEPPAFSPDSGPPTRTDTVSPTDKLLRLYGYRGWHGYNMSCAHESLELGPKTSETLRTNEGRLFQTTGAA